jgi:hypothetical protein
MKRPNIKDYNLTDTDSLADYISAWNEYSNLLKLDLMNFKKDLLELCEIEQNKTGEVKYTLTQDNLDKLIKN